MAEQSNQSSWVSDFKSTINSAKSSVNYLLSPICEFYHSIPIWEYKKCISDTISHYDKQIPSDIANVKIEIIDNISENNRLIILGLLSIGTVFALRKGPLNVVRNSVFSYFGYGWIIAPEVFNPILVKKQ
ncbi:hypothetical protein pb186bvf_011521 [Paramecium bursaria]